MNKLQKIDRTILFTILILLVFGLVMISSAGIAYSTSRFDNPYFFFKKQLFGVAVGLIFLFLAQRIHYDFWKKIAFPFFVVSLVCLCLVFIEGLGSRIYGASRWLQLGPLSFQPSEMLKLSLIIYLAAWLEGRGEKIRDFFDGFVPFVAIVAVISFLLLKQPDMGTLGILIMVAISIFFASGSKLTHIFWMLGGGVVALLALIRMESYRFDRLMVFLHPETDPQGIGYQINQALLALGSGGIVGAGLGHSLQKFNYLPEPVGDSIFAIIGEELGFVGAAFLVILFAFFALQGLRIAKNAPDVFSKLVAIGITAWIFFQAMINMSAISGLIPLTGVPLPFISYGGTSVAFLLVGIGILLNISKHSKSSI